MDRMNVEFEYQVRRALAPWLLPAGAVQAPVEQQPLTQERRAVARWVSHWHGRIEMSGAAKPIRPSVQPVEPLRAARHHLADRLLRRTLDQLAHHRRRAGEEAVGCG